MMLSIIGEQKKHLEEQEVQRVNFEPVSLSPAHSFIINYLTDDSRNGTCFPMEDYTVCDRYQTDSQHPWFTVRWYWRMFCQRSAYFNISRMFIAILQWGLPGLCLKCLLKMRLGGEAEQPGNF